MFFTPRLILVEGLEDVAYITAYLHLMDMWDEFRRAGCHIVPTNGKSELVQPLAIATYLRIPTFVVFDADADKPDRSGSRVKSNKDNIALLGLLGVSEQQTVLTDTLWGKGFVAWYSDIGAVVRGDLGDQMWTTAQGSADRRYSQAGGLKKNTLHIGAAMAYAWREGSRSANLEKLCERLLDPAECVGEVV
jgi:hypothetical protein